MTAVEWLVLQIYGEHTKAWHEEIQQAILMEKEQILKAYKFNATGEPDGAEHYYEIFYNKNKP